ncbi:MAG: YrdB family protein [Actinomycetia bacterium]|nr:YrdB family protein [Actinomycetes bacterium]MCP5030683.1 YrdB family protein [Actinomycetes bacterium]
MRSWNLALRLGLEIAALTGLGIAAWNQTEGAARSIAVMIAPLAAAALWGVFNVLDDPSRSGQAPIEVPGWVRLLIELLVLGSGGVAYGVAGYPVIGAAFAVLTVVHYTVGRARVHWLLSRPAPAQR